MDDYNKFPEENKLFLIFIDIIMGISVGTILVSILQLLGITSLLSIIITYIISVPSAITGINIIKKRVDDSFNKDMYRMHQLFNSLHESLEKDHQITKNTAIFHQEIKEKSEGIEIDSSSLNAINQFLYMINENYYEKITTTLSSLSREEIIDKVLEQIVIYLKDNNQTTFSDVDVHALLDHCYFISDNIKQEMEKEFKAAKCRRGSLIDYIIVSKNIPNIDYILDSNNKYDVTDHRLRLFDINDHEHYKMLIKALNDSKYNSYGDMEKIIWDFESIIKIVNIIIKKYRKDFIKDNPEFYNFDLVCSYLLNIAIYCLVNNYPEAGPAEAIQTMKHWSYLTHNQKLELIDTIIEELGLDYDLHPYRNQKPQETKKVIKFPSAE